MRFRFTQTAQALPAAPGVESHQLRAIEGAPEHARLSAGDDALDGPLDYRLELLSDTGPAAASYGALMLVAFDVPEERVEEVAEWYDQEHIKLLMRASGWLRARRFAVLDHRGKRWTSVAFHELLDVSVMGSEERRFARSTPWRARLERETWFMDAGRWVYVPSR